MSARSLNARDVMEKARAAHPHVPMFVRTIIIAALAAALAGMLARGAAAQTPDEQAAQSIVRLNPTVTVTGALVRLGDLADSGGMKADVPLFRAPLPGMTGTVQAERVVAAIRAQGFTHVETGGAARIVVTRSGRRIAREDIRQAVAERLVHLGYARTADALDVRIDPSFGELIVEADASGDLHVTAINADPRARRFTARLSIDGSAVTAGGIEISGFAEQIANVPTLARPVARGEQIAPADVVMTPMPISAVSADAVTSREAVFGMAARRPLRAGQPLRPNDLMEPILVRRDDVVLIQFKRPGLSLTVRGRAVSNGSKGDVIAVTNLQSRRILQAEVTAPGVVSVQSGVSSIAAANIQ